MADTKHTSGPWSVESVWDGRPLVAQVARFGRAIYVRDGIAQEAAFLLDRLSDLEWSDIPEDFWRDWNGHVEPSIARLRAALHSTQEG